MGKQRTSGGLEFISLFWKQIFRFHRFCTNASTCQWSLSSCCGCFWGAGEGESCDLETKTREKRFLLSGFCVCEKCSFVYGYRCEKTQGRVLLTVYIEPLCCVFRFTLHWKMTPPSRGGGEYLQILLPVPIRTCCSLGGAFVYLFNLLLSRSAVLKLYFTKVNPYKKMYQTCS